MVILRPAERDVRSEWPPFGLDAQVGQQRLGRRQPALTTAARVRQSDPKHPRPRLAGETSGLPEDQLERLDGRTRGDDGALDVGQQVWFDVTEEFQREMKLRIL